MKVARCAALGFALSVFGWTAAHSIETNIGPRPGTWQGLYAGVHAGFGRATTSWTSNFFVDSGEFSGSGTLIGITAGYNWQSGRLVFGVEGDLSSSTMRPISEAGCLLDCRTELSQLATLRGRLGYLFTPDLLVYGTAGFSTGKFRHGVFSFTTGAGSNTGLVYGGGIEKVIHQRWTAKAEYIYLNSDGGVGCDPVFCATDTRNKFGAHIFRFGLNYHFAPLGNQPAAARTPGWQGFYTSAVLGYGRGYTQWSDPALGTSEAFNGKGSALGFGAGHNWQNGAWVFGIEGDAVLTWIKAVSATPFCLCFSAETEVAQLFTVRGRAGYLVTPNTLLFLTGGAAAASLKFGNVNQGTGNALELGTVLGAGIEVQTSSNLSIRGDFLLAMFDSSVACGFGICGTTMYSDYVRIPMMRLVLSRYY